MIKKGKEVNGLQNIKEVGIFLGIVKNSIFSSVHRRLKRERIRDRKIKKSVEALKFKLSKDQE